MIHGLIFEYESKFSFTSYLTIESNSIIFFITEPNVKFDTKNIKMDSNSIQFSNYLHSPGYLVSSTSLYQFTKNIILHFGLRKQKQLL